MTMESLGRLVRRSTDVPPFIAGGFTPAGLDAEDGEDLVDAARDWEALRQLHVDLRGITLGIEYVDAKGAKSARRVTFLELYTEGDTYYIRAKCHERNALRTFVATRILSVFDMDGEVHDNPAAFIMSLLAAAGLDGKPAPGVAQMAVAKHGLSVLVSLSRADGTMHPEELDVIVRYVAARSELEGLDFRKSDEKAVRDFVRRLYPDPQALSGALRRLDREGGMEKRLFLRHARMVMEADGHCDWEEIQVLDQINAAVTA